MNEKLYYIITSQKKAEMLKKYFFSDELQANFNNMKEAIYFLEMKLLL